MAFASLQACQAATRRGTARVLSGDDSAICCVSYGLQGERCEVCHIDVFVPSMKTSPCRYQSSQENCFVLAAPWLASRAMT
jgi:hypothetical protein